MTARHREERARRCARPGIAAIIAIGLALVSLACARTVTHEANATPYDAYDMSGGATYASTPASTAGIPAYRGDVVAQVDTPGDAAVDERAMGIVDVDPDVPYQYEGWYAAAFYFPQGTFTGGSPSQKGEIEIMRWSGSANQFGGIRIGSDQRAQLVRGNGGSVTGNIGPDFQLDEGCWNWLAVRQRLGTGANAKNEVWLNGQKVVSANGQQNTDTPSGVTDVRFGYSTSDAQQDTPLTYYVDDATTASGPGGAKDPAAGVCGQPSPGVERPNILIFETDDQRVRTEDSRPSAPGSPYLMEVTRQKFKAEGEDYREAYATTPQCCPSRSSIFTGRYAHNHTVYENGMAANLGFSESSPNQQTTLQYYVKTQAGYKTAIFGKMLNSWPLNTKPPYFDDWAVFKNFDEDNPNTPANELQPHMSVSAHTPDICESSGPNFELSEACMGERNSSGANVKKPLPSGVYETDFLATKVSNFLAEAEDTPGEDDVPWLMYVTPTVPHAPFTPKSTYDNLEISSFADDVPGASLESDRSDKPRYVRDSPEPVPASQAETEHDAQLRMLKSADDLLQEVFTEMDNRGETGTTLAFFLSDNGFLWGEHGLSGKHRPYQESVRIPLMTRWPGHPEQVATGQTDQRLAANIDIAPTVMSALGLSPPAQNEPMDGVSLFGPDSRSRLLVEGWVKDPLPGFGGARPLCEEEGYCRPENTPPTPAGEVVPSFEPPTWAGTVTRGPQGYLYDRYYLFDPSTTPPTENRPIFREFFANSDTFQLDNYYGPDGTPGGGDDLGVPPPEGMLGSQLERDRACKGHGPPGSWPPPCP
jgi:arylsulfatase A-like enzyme